MKKVVIYGAGNTGKSAYFYLKTQNKYDCLLFIDSDQEKWGQSFDGVLIKSPDVLVDMENIEIIIASIYWSEILESIQKMNLKNTDIAVYQPVLNMRDSDLFNYLTRELNHRTIDLGNFLINEKEIVCKELTFVLGGSSILDYAFLKTIAKRFCCKNYLEIGTYIGESINLLTDCCEKLYSITAPLLGSYSADNYCQSLNIPNYSERLTYNDKIIHFFTDSKTFDYSRIEDEIDLYFIDGDHSYKGVYADTKNIFKTKSEGSIVVWHDFRTSDYQYNKEVIRAVYDVLGNQFKNVYVTNQNFCGVYLPDEYINMFALRELKYEKDAELYTYDVKLTNCQIK